MKKSYEDYQRELLDIEEYSSLMKRASHYELEKVHILNQKIIANKTKISREDNGQILMNLFGINPFFNITEKKEEIIQPFFLFFPDSKVKEAFKKVGLSDRTINTLFNLEAVVNELKNLFKKGILFPPTTVFNQILHHGYHSALNIAIKDLNFTVPDDRIVEQNEFLKKLKDIERRLSDDKRGVSVITPKDKFDNFLIKYYEIMKSRVVDFLFENQDELEEEVIKLIWNNFLKLDTRIFLSGMAFLQPQSISENEKYNQLYDLFRLIKTPTSKPLQTYDEFVKEYSDPSIKINDEKTLTAMYRKERIKRVRAILRYS